VHGWLAVGGMGQLRAPGFGDGRVGETRRDYEHGYRGTYPRTSARSALASGWLSPATSLLV